MDVATRSLEEAEAQLNGFIDRQAAKVKEDRAGQERANSLEAELRAAEQRRTTQMHRENKTLWYMHFLKMSANHARISQEYAERAERLCEEGAA